MISLKARDALCGHVQSVTAEARPQPGTQSRLGGPIYAVFAEAEAGAGRGPFLGLVTERGIVAYPERIFIDLLPPHPPVPVEPDTSLEEVLRRVDLQSLEAIPVLDPEGAFVGAITRTSLLSAILRNERALLEESERLRLKVEEDRQRLGELYSASKSLLGLLVMHSLEEDLLPKGIEAVAQLVQARYGAVGIRDEAGQLSRLAYTGFTPEEAQQVGPLLQGLALWDAGVRENRILHLEDLSRDPGAAGFRPPPSVRSLLAAPISYQGRIYGRVCVCDKTTGEPFGAEDELLCMSFANSLSLVLSRAHALAEHRGAEERYRRIVETSREGIWTIDAQNNTTFVNARMAEMLGYTVNEMVGMSLFAFMDEEDKKTAVANVERRRRGIAERHDFRLRRRDGTYLWTSMCTNPLCDKDGRYAGALAMVTDITDRKRAEEEIHRRNQELAVLNAVTAAVSSFLELPEVLATLQRQLAERLHVPGGCIFFYDEAVDRLDLQTGWGLPRAILDQFRAFPVSGSHNEQVVRNRDAVLQRDFREVAAFSAAGLDAARPDWQGYLGVPLLAEGEIQGVLDLFSRAPTTFSENQVTFFKAMGQEVGVAIQHARLFEEVRAGRERLKALSERLVAVQEAERRHLARELHDEVGQVLTGLKLTLETSMRLPVEEIRARLNEGRALVDRLIAQVRELSLDLRPAMLDDLGLLPALLWHFERYTTLTQVRVVFAHAGLERRFRPEVETAAYRVVQEALTNVARHAGVNEVKVRLWADVAALGAEIEDQGRGFDPQAMLAGGGTGGLAGMRERAVLLGGQLTVESAPGRGTRLTVEMPLDDPNGKRKKKR